MLKEKELTKIKQLHYKDGESITFKSITVQLSTLASSRDVPLAFGNEEIKSGSLLNSNTVDCLIMFHPQYEAKYNYYVFSIARQGKYAFVDIYLSGTSKQGLAMEAKEQILSGNLSSLTSSGKGRVIGALIGSTINGSMFKTKDSFKEEERWYTMVNDLLNEVFD
ncbi:MAG: hypothetical protein E7439_05310 [Ruminococcaceae bacterium]|nr:hypothetical protein [Oscillospiraceae bacterium]